MYCINKSNMLYIKTKLSTIKIKDENIVVKKNILLNLNFINIR